MVRRREAQSNTRGDRRATTQKVEAIRKETDAQAVALLTPDQDARLAEADRRAGRPQPGHSRGSLSRRCRLMPDEGQGPNKKVAESPEGPPAFRRDRDGGGRLDLAALEPDGRVLWGR